VPSGRSASAGSEYRWRPESASLKSFQPPVQLHGLPLKDFRADVDLIGAPDEGTLITWSATWRTGVPGTGLITEAMFARLYRRFATGLAQQAAGL
jgi:hypothetical protein